MRISTTTIAAALLLSSEAYAAQVGRNRKVKIYSSSSLRRDPAVGRDVVDPYIGLADEREHRHLQIINGSMSIMSIPPAGMSIPLDSMSIPPAGMSIPLDSMSIPLASVSIPLDIMSIPLASMPGFSFSLPIMDIGPVIPPTSTTVAPSTTAVATTEPPLASVCIEVYEPVCGEDGVTYDNDCKAGVANVTIVYPGECLEAAANTTTTTTNPTDAFDTTTEATVPLSNETFIPSPTWLPVSDETSSPTSSPTFEVPQAKYGAPSSAMMMGQSSVVVATVVWCVIAGAVALM